MTNILKHSDVRDGDILTEKCWLVSYQIQNIDVRKSMKTKMRITTKEEQMRWSDSLRERSVLI